MECSDPELLRHYNKASQQSYDRARDPYSKAVLDLCQPKHIETLEPSNTFENVHGTTPVKVKFQNVNTFPHISMYKNKLPPMPVQVAEPAQQGRLSRPRRKVKPSQQKTRPSQQNQPH